MYQIIVRELSDRKLWSSRTLAEERCRISALSSADFCLRDRTEEDWGRFAFRGSKKEISRLFEAENLNTAALDRLSEVRDYSVVFLGRPRLKVVPQAG